tara:strand:+ start:949 stop:1659 length:711 start_codon:yes stop_codon:yes gene_type:complete
MARAGALEGPRTLSAMVPSYLGKYGTVAGGAAYDGWQILGDAANKQQGNGWQAAGTTGIYYETYMDLSGYELDDMTFFPAEAGFQDPGLYNGSVATKQMWVMDIISQQRLSATTLQNMLDGTLNNYNNAPGMMGSDVMYSELTMGNLRVLGNSLQVSTSTNQPFIVQSASPFGSGHPVVVQKLWCYRFIYYDATTLGDEMTIPASRFVLAGTAAKEKDNVYIQRLKNSYETQGSLT